jgi:hypothetical protein
MSERGSVEFTQDNLNQHLESQGRAPMKSLYKFDNETKKEVK